ncbi:lysine-specific demethylase 6B-like protein [Lates japonicus]|uniref:Lysine-specific demethylase 6B-like protein n=1 Tax=Lates japonicus TaxID=270547 RepID=A0AAD3NLS7_LATJO|nr:lysine-specific demethylase 6B-like protein [Lates japonicus]
MKRKDRRKESLPVCQSIIEFGPESLSPPFLSELIARQFFALRCEVEGLPDTDQDWQPSSLNSELWQQTATSREAEWEGRAETVFTSRPHPVCLTATKIIIISLSAAQATPEPNSTTPTTFSRGEGLHGAITTNKAQWRFYQQSTCSLQSSLLMRKLWQERSINHSQCSPGLSGQKKLREASIYTPKTQPDIQHISQHPHNGPKSTGFRHWHREDLTALCSATYSSPQQVRANKSEKELKHHKTLRRIKASQHPNIEAQWARSESSRGATQAITCKYPHPSCTSPQPSSKSEITKVPERTAVTIKLLSGINQLQPPS